MLPAASVSAESASPRFKVSRKRRAGIRQVRKTTSDGDDEAEQEDGNDECGDHLAPGDDDDVLAKVRKAKELQRLRQRSSGLSHVSLAVGKKIDKVTELVAVDTSDPFKVAKLTESTASEVAKKTLVADVSGGDDLGPVGTQFSKETRVRDEDEEMRKFIEAEMEKRRRGVEDAQLDDQRRDAAKDGSYLTAEARALQSLPDHLRKSTFKKNEEMLSSQMLSGIPEIDLGIEEKIRNIEATEKAKKRLAEHEKRKEKAPDFVPANLAVNFKHHNRFRRDEDLSRDFPGTSTSRKDHTDRSIVVTKRTVVVGDVPEEKVISLADDKRNDSKTVDRATDELHLTKFKQHFHRK